MDYDGMSHHYSLPPSRFLTAYRLLLTTLIISEIVFWNEILVAPLQLISNKYLSLVLLCFVNMFIVWKFAQWIDYEHVVSLFAETINMGSVGIILITIGITSIYLFGVVPAGLLVFLLLISNEVAIGVAGITGDIIASQLLSTIVVFFSAAFLGNALTKSISNSPAPLALETMSYGKEFNKKISFYDGRFIGFLNGMLIDSKTNSKLHNDSFGVANVIYSNPYLLVQTHLSRLFLWKHESTWTFIGVMKLQDNVISFENDKAYSAVIKISRLDNLIVFKCYSGIYTTENISQTMNATKLDSNVKAIGKYQDYLIYLLQQKQQGLKGSLGFMVTPIKFGAMEIQLKEKIILPKDLEIRKDTIAIIASNGLFIYRITESSATLLFNEIDRNVKFKPIPNDFNNRFVFLKKHMVGRSILEMDTSGNFKEIAIPRKLNIYSVNGRYANASLGTKALRIPYTHLNQLIY